MGESVLQYSFVFTACVTVVGWFFEARQTERREFRKEVREQMDELQKRVQNVRDATAEYWLRADSKSAPPAAAELKGQLLSLVRQINVLNLSGIATDPGIMAELREAATGGDFEKKGRRRSSKDVERVTDVMLISEDFLSQADALFYKKFPAFQPNNFWAFFPAPIFLALSSDAHG